MSCAMRFARYAKSRNGRDVSLPAAKPMETGRTGPKTARTTRRSSHRGRSRKKKKAKHPLRKIIIIVVILALAAAGVVYWMNSRHYEDTDDAQVDGHISGISARVAGTVTAVYFEENQFVKAGQVVVDLDPSDYKVAVEQARSQLAQAQAQTQAEQPNVPVTQVTNQTTIANASSDVASAQAAIAASSRIMTQRWRRFAKRKPTARKRRPMWKGTGRWRTKTKCRASSSTRWWPRPRPWRRRWRPVKPARSPHRTG